MTMRALLLLPAWLVSLTVNAAQEQSRQQGPLASSPVGVGEFVQMFLGLLVVIVVIVAMAWAIRRMGYVQTRISGALKILGSISLGQRERVVLMQVGEQQLLVGIAPGQIRTLLVLEENLSVETLQPAIVQSGFAQKLQAMMKGDKT